MRLIILVSTLALLLSIPPRSRAWLAPAVQAATYNITPFLVSDKGVNLNPTIAGNYIVWASVGNEGSEDIYAYDVRTEDRFRVAATTTPIHKWYTISGELLIWGDDKIWGEPNVVKAFDLDARNQIPLPSNLPSSVSWPTSSSNMLVWGDYGVCAKTGLCTSRIYAYDFRDQISRLVAEGAAGRPVTDGEIVIWSTNEGYHWPAQSPVFGNVKGFDVHVGSAFSMTDSKRAMNPAISGDTVVWQDDRNSGSGMFYSDNTDIYGYDLAAKREFPISTAPGKQINPDISSNLIVWQDSRSGNWDIYGYDLATKTEFPIAVGPGHQVSPAISGHVVVWVDEGTKESGGNVVGARISTPQDWSVPDGHFYTQTNGYGGAGGTGYSVVDRGGIPFWTTFQSVGGVGDAGYPTSRRFFWKGFWTQAMQKLVFQWRPESGQVYFVNVFDELSLAGLDDWLYVHRQTPYIFDTSPDTGLPWEQVVARHLAFLDSDPAIKERYFAEPDWLNRFGLPMSYGDFGDVFVVRTQRVVLQRWKLDTPWARVGEVVIANGGDIAKELGLFPAEAVVPEPPPG